MRKWQKLTAPKTLSTVPALLRAATDARKDQTYMLAALSPESLSRMRFPLGEHTKPHVRAIAAASDSLRAVANDA